MNRPTRIVLNRVLGLVALVAGLAGCGKQTPIPVSSSEPAKPAPLARVNDRELRVEEVKAEMQRRRDARRSTGDAASVLDEMVERELMLQAARRSDWMNDPEVKRELENELLARWLSRTVRVRKDAVTVSDDELQQAYEERRAEFSKPPLTRLAILYRKSSPKEPAELMETRRAELEKGRAAYLADPTAARQGGRMKGFGAIAAKYSEETVSRYRGGDLGWLDLSRDQDRWPTRVVEAGRALEIDAVSEVLSTEDGLFVVMKTDERDEAITPFEDVAASLRRRLIRERQDGVREVFLAELKQDSRIAIDADQLTALTESFPLVADPAEPTLLTGPLTESTPQLRGNLP